jgi:hypothetical protein
MTKATPKRPVDMTPAARATFTKAFTAKGWTWAGLARLLTVRFASDSLDNFERALVVARAARREELTDKAAKATAKAV